MGVSSVLREMAQKAPNAADRDTMMLAASIAQGMERLEEKRRDIERALEGLDWFEGLREDQRFVMVQAVLDAKHSLGVFD